MIKRGEEGRFHGGAQSIALRVEGFAQSDALRSAPGFNHTRRKRLVSKMVPFFSCRH